MGLVELLGYRAPEPGPLQKVVNRLAGTRPGAAVAAPILRRLDLMALRSGGGAVTERMGGQPVIWLEVPRRHRGDSRLVPLLPIPFGAHIAVIGSNFGREREPAWVADLLAARGIEVTMGKGRCGRGPGPPLPMKPRRCGEPRVTSIPATCAIADRSPAARSRCSCWSRSPGYRHRRELPGAGPHHRVLAT